jgi:hypothetical protein
MLVYFLSFIIGAFAGASNDLFASVGVGSASVRGFSWTYDIRNPDLIDPPGKVYWVLTDDGVAMTTADIMAGNNPTQSNCFGQATQVDSDIHEQRMDCSLTAGVKYLFWVAVDYDGDGTEAVDCTVGGVPVIPQVDKDCDGVWSTCDEDCIQYYSITQYPSGDGAGCEIGDEEERVCAPGTDQCPLNGSYDTYNPKPEGFDLGLTPDPSANTAGGMWYYIVTPPNATPTPDEVQTGSGGLCGGSYAISDASQEDVQTINCNLHCQTLYDVWVAQDSNGDGTATILTPTKQVTLPCPLPVGNLFAHTPTATGHMISYDIDNPVATGKFYYKTLPLGSPNPTAAEIRDCADGVCCGSVQQTVPAPMTTLTNANCPLTPGDYVVWGEVDTDGNGADASLTNAGVAFQFTYVEPTDGPTQPAPPVTTTSTYSTNTPVSSTSQNTQPPVTDHQLADWVDIALSIQVKSARTTKLETASLHIFTTRSYFQTSELATEVTSPVAPDSFHKTEPGTEGAVLFSILEESPENADASELVMFATEMNPNTDEPSSSSVCPRKVAVWQRSSQLTLS